MRRHARSSLGFTLTEMAIVLGIVGVLAAGLWNLMSGANEQVRDSAAANQHSQLVASVKAFLSSQQGQNYMTSNAIPVASGGCGGTCAASKNILVPLPGAGCTFAGAFGADVNLPFLCGFLPAGFTNTTVNAYGQTYVIMAQRDNTTGTLPNTYSSIIMTTGGSTIPDTSGARISSLIGGDGGFIYTNPVCTAAASSTVACGSFGGWTATLPGAGPAGYGFGAPITAVPAFGTIVSRTYVSPQQNSFYSWLARVPMAGDSLYSLNSMTTPEYLGNNALVMGTYTAGATPDTLSKSIYMGNFDSVALPTTGGGSINMQGGTFNFVTPTATTGGGTMNVQGGTIDLGSNTGQILGSGSSMINLAGSAATVNPLLSVNNPATCSMTAPSVPAACPYAMQATTISVANLLNANALYANTFIYSSSDIRLKKNIQPIENALDDVMKLKPVSFNFKAGGEKGLGVIAQDVEKVYPELVSDGNFKSVNYSGFIGPLIGAVQELKKENDELRRQLHQQSVREDALEEELRNGKK